MTPDRNKTPLTHAITQRVAQWMDDHGFKPVETEVWLGDRWNADLAGVITPTQTELIGLKLIRRPPPTWGADWTDERKVSAHADHALWSTDRAAIPPILTCAIEVKASRSDFRGDWKWQAPAQTDLRYIAMPKGLIPDFEWPAGWGIILTSEDGSAIHRVHKPTVTSMSADQRLKVVLSIAVRRDNVTRYARLRELQKQVTVDEAHRRVAGRLQDAIGVVTDVMEGETVERALNRRGIRTKLPDWTVEALEKLRPSNRPVSLNERLEVVA